MSNVENNKWKDEDMLAFAKVASGGAYGEYEGCNTLESKLVRFKKLTTISKMNTTET